MAWSRELGRARKNEVIDVWRPEADSSSRVVRDCVIGQGSDERALASTSTTRRRRRGDKARWAGNTLPIEMWLWGNVPATAPRAHGATVLATCRCYSRQRAPMIPCHACLMPSYRVLVDAETAQASPVAIPRGTTFPYTRHLAGSEGGAHHDGVRFNSTSHRLERGVAICRL